MNGHVCLICQSVSDWARHKQEHKEIVRIQLLIEEDNPKSWAKELDHFSTSYFRVMDPDIAELQMGDYKLRCQDSSNR